MVTMVIIVITQAVATGWLSETFLSFEEHRSFELGPDGTHVIWPHRNSRAHADVARQPRYHSVPTDPLLKFVPSRRRAPQGLVPLKPGTAGYSSVGRTQDLPGSWGIPPVPLPRSRIPASSSGLAIPPKRCSPHLADSEGADITDMSGLNHAASVPAAYASNSTLPHRLQGSLPVGG